MRSCGDKTASIKLHPALIFMAIMIGGVVAHKVWPIGIGLDNLPLLKRAGAGIILLGLGACFLAYWALWRAGTNIDPSKPTTTLVSTGIYAYSRNPVYLGLCLFLTGMALAKNSLVLLVDAMLLIILLYWAVILEEEAYLEIKFGEEYLRYKKKVRRWL